MQEDRRIHPLGFREELAELILIGELLREIGIEQNAFHAEPIDAAIQLLQGLVHILQRQNDETRETLRVLPSEISNPVVANTRRRQAFLPKLSDLRSASKIYDPESVTDQAMMDKMTSVLQAETFANDVFGKLSAYLVSIERDLGRLYGAAVSDPGDAS